MQSEVEIGVALAQLQTRTGELVAFLRNEAADRTAELLLYGTVETRSLQPRPYYGTISRLTRIVFPNISTDPNLAGQRVHCVCGGDRAKPWTLPEVTAEALPLCQSTIESLRGYFAGLLEGVTDESARRKRLSGEGRVALDTLTSLMETEAVLLQIRSW